MYSLIIQNQNTIKRFMDHYSLFLDSLENGEIGYCKWIESGTTVETAVPELLDLVKEKEEWRAIIIYESDGREDSLYDVNPFNPYDFCLKEKIPDDDLECPVPLVRLAQILGGVPAPEIRFIPELIKDAGKPTTIKYNPEKNESAIRAQALLQEKYDFDGKKPSEIWIVSMRETPRSDVLKGVQDAWMSHDEKDSSSFASRNRYPSSCRFMVYDYELEGPCQKKADEFNFWTSVLLLSLNYIDPDILQGYRLYNVKCEFDKKSMEAFFQSTANVADGILKMLELKREKIIQGDLREANNLHQRTAVRDDVEIDPIELRIPSGKGIDYRFFKVYSDSEEGEMSGWRSMNAAAREEINELVKNAERRLNKRAEEMRQKNRVNREEVRPLDRFELEDSEKILSHYYDNILELQKELPDTTIEETEDEKKAAEDITDLIRTRISKRRVADTALVIDLIILLLSLPVIAIYFWKGLAERALFALFLSFCMMLVIMIPMYIVLLCNRYILRKRIKRYNEMLNDRLGAIKMNEESYTSFVHDIVVYSKGYDYLRVMKEKQKQEIDGFSMLLKHFGAIDSFRHRIAEWGKAFHLSLVFNKDMANVFIDTGVAPAHNRAYSIAQDRRQEIPVNSGECIYSPFDFVTKLIISREELYDTPFDEETEVDEFF